MKRIMMALSMLRTKCEKFQGLDIIFGGNEMDCEEVDRVMNLVIQKY